MLSYQHAFHAGNRADVFKHAVLEGVLSRAVAGHAPLAFIDTHAGRAVYRLDAPEALRTGEARAGVLALSEVGAGPVLPVLQSWLQRVRDFNGSGDGLRYPGSPALAAQILRRQDRLILFERHPGEHAALDEAMSGDERVRCIRGDGFAGSLSIAPRRSERLIVHVDPSYETIDDIAGVAKWVGTARRRWRDAILLIWIPLFADRREATLEDVLADAGGGARAEAVWPLPAGKDHGLRGSAMWLFGLPAETVDHARRIGSDLSRFWAA